MRHRNSLINILYADRKNLYIVLFLLLVLIFTLTVVYAALSTTLNITGNAEVSAASWDIYLDNVQLNSHSVTPAVPTISNKTTASFSTTLTNPGDFYEFTIDVVNDGSIDAMIDSVTKTPELSDTQKKYLNYTVEYQNGEAINTKQLVMKESFVRLKVKVEFRKDISASDLPTQSETLSLSFRVNYVQSDETGISVNNNGKLIKIVSGDYDTVGSEVCIGDECFYVMSRDGNSVKLFAKYNLYVGNSVNEDYDVIPLENPTGRQDSNTSAFQFDWENYELFNFPWIGTVAFSETNYWWDSDLNVLKVDYTTYLDDEDMIFPYVYDINSSIYNYIENYKTYLESKGAKIEEARLISVEELDRELGCGSGSFTCIGAPSWVYSVSFWTGSADDSNIITVTTDGSFGSKMCGYYENYFGVRPVIKLSIS